MSTAQPTSTSMITEVWQLVGVEELILVVTAIIALAFSGALSKPPESLKLKRHRAEQTRSSKSSEIPKLKRGDVALIQSVMQERPQSGFQGAWDEEPAQKSRQMPSASSGVSGEEPAKKNGLQRWSDRRQVQRNAAIVSSGDPIKAALVEKIKSFQIAGQEEKYAWETFCASQEGNYRNPALYSLDVLQQFVQDCCSSEERSSHLRWDQKKLPPPPPPPPPGDPIKAALVDKVRSSQKAGREEKYAWETFCESQEGNNRDPARYPVDVLQQFVQEHCCSEGRSSPPCNARKQPRCLLLKKVELLIGYASRHQDADAIEIFEEIKATGESTAFPDALKYDNHLPVDVFNMLVQCAGRIGRTELIEVLFEDMATAGIARPLAFYNSTMKMLASKKYYKEGMYVYSCLEADGLEPPPVMLSCLVTFAGELGDSERAISFFNRLAACSTPSFHDYIAILHVHSRNHNWSKSAALLRDMQDRQVPIDSIALNLVLSAGVAAGHVEAAEALLQEFSLSGMADVISYNSIMDGYMCQVGPWPNAIPLNTAMDAAMPSCQVTNAWQVHARMVEAGVAPDKVTCTVLMKGLHCGASSGQLVVMLELMQNVPQDCDSTVFEEMWHSLITAIAHVNDPDLAARAMAQMLDQQVMLPPEEYQQLLKVPSFDKDGNRMEQSKKTMLALHDIGKCSPCAFIYDKRGCKRGPACPKCHMCPPEELSKAFDEKKALMKARLAKAQKDFRREKGRVCEARKLLKITTA